MDQTAYNFLFMMGNINLKLQNILLTQTYLKSNLSSPAALAPTGLTAVQEGATRIQVSWTPPNPLGDTTGYRIHYSGGSSGSEDVIGGSTHNHLLTGLNGYNYIIYIVGTSGHFNSEIVEYPNFIALSK